MDELSKMIAQIAQELKDPAVNAALGAARMQAFSSLSQNLLAIAFGAAAAFLARKIWLRMKAKNNDWEEPEMFAAIIGLGVLGLVTVVGVFGFCSMFDPWLYATMVNPELWIAKRILGL